ncbi:hypothetical protein LVJ59_07990 [Microbacterium sp. KKR3/1]|uniref:hypothetical protein n=1 Tax=Microbacterium sp. KKR3/1 TaxID=2904241 RepID=UPI001E61A059|nr:hypothetical protein [Microbacterium sp. KKR3/1]MCE0508977.1 hypothetical protein [Microbacterium sp. KKR3/1]
MNELAINGRTITVTHVDTQPSEYGDIQRYRIEMSESDVTARLSGLSSDAAVNARVMASAIDCELLLEYAGSDETGLLRDPSIREWRDQNRDLIEAELARLHKVAAALPAEPMSDLERSLWRAIEADERGRGG